MNMASWIRYVHRLHRQYSMCTQCPWWDQITVRVQSINGLNTDIAYPVFVQVYSFLYIHEVFKPRDSQSNLQTQKGGRPAVRVFVCLCQIFRISYRITTSIGVQTKNAE